MQKITNTHHKMSPATTAKTATTAAEVKSQALQLRKIRHRHAARVAMQARIVASAAKKLVELDEALRQECIAVAGVDFEDFHEPLFDCNRSTEGQQGFSDILKYADDVATEAAAIADAAKAPPLPHEERNLSYAEGCFAAGRE
jgi:hypothetical protein